MHDEICRKLDRIDELFPRERLEASKERIRALKNNRKPDRLPFILASLGFNYYNDVMPSKECLKRMLDEIIAHGHTRDDFIPHFFPGCRQATIPNMFGAKEIVEVRNDGSLEYGISERLLGPDDDPENLPDPDITAGSIASNWLEMQKYVLEETDGRLPISVIDMQGPMDVAGQLWGYENLFMDAMSGGTKSHNLLTKCTTAFIRLWQKQVDLLGDLFVGTHLWGWSWVESGAGHGATVSMDSMAMISADFFLEHTREHLLRISKEFGGLTIHSCGKFGGVIPGINSIPGIEGINASQMTIQQLLDAGASPDLFFVLLLDYSRLAEEYALIKSGNLKVEMTVGGVWPEGRQSIEQFGELDWKLLREKEDHILKMVTL
jgi:hypothetical protein